jgi:acyl carrier protein
MELSTFIKNFEKQFDDITPDSLKADTVFKDLDDWDSMTALSIIAMVDEEYSIKLTGNEIKQSQTIEDIYNVIKNKR